jgi:diacylglycerol kinase (ATP)
MQERMSYRHTLEPPPRRRIDRGMRSLIAAFGYAFAGVWYMISTQRNAQIHTLIAACAVALGLTLGLERWEWLSLVLVITMVLAAEGVNTAVEAAVDVATSVHHPLAKVAKDVAAGTVLICAIAAVIVGCIVFLPHLLSMLN